MKNVYQGLSKRTWRPSDFNSRGRLIGSGSSQFRLIPRRALQGFLLTFAIILPLSQDSGAQVVDPVTTAQAPVPGVGHHYIEMGAETVNPADGSVTFNLPIQMPAGRGLSFPFAIRYNEEQPFFISNSGVGGTTFQSLNWATAIENGTLPPFDLNGWSYQLPHYEAQATVSAAQLASSPSSGNVQYNYCFETQDYNFSGFDGLSETLYSGITWQDPSNPYPQYNPCTPNISSNGGAYGSGGSFGTMPSGTSNQPSLTVTDRSGTVYQFPQVGMSPNPTLGQVLPFGALAQTITDRNGNQIVLNGTSAAVGGNPQGWTYGILPAGSYTDTLGRTILSWTGLGGNASTGPQDTLNVSGLGPIQVKWTTTTVTFPGNATVVPGSTATCSFGGTQSIPMSVASEIDLPNGQKYSFTYGGTWGRLTQIHFPEGGYVRYVWGTNAGSKLTYQTWMINTENGSGYYGGGGPGSCWAWVDTPAITDRYVSFDGSSEILHQHFSYATAQVNLTSGLPYWSSKNTTVTSTDLVTGQSTVTNYTYGSVGAAVGPNDSAPPGQWTQGNQIPVEQTVVYQDGSGNTLQTVNKTWADQFGMIGEQTILNDGQGKTTLRCLDYYDRVWAANEYDFQAAGSNPSPNVSLPPGASGPGVWCQLPSGATSITGTLNLGAIGPLKRQTNTLYHHFGINVLDEPDSVTVLDGSGNQVKQTSYGYDATALASSGVSPSLLVSAPGGSVRGNATSVSRWLNTTGSTLNTTYTYYDTGQVQSMTDPCGNNGCSSDMVGASHTTTYSYTDSPASGTASPSVQTNSYLTKVTNPLGQTQSFAWDYSRGLLMSSIDQNNQTTNYTYNTPPSNCTWEDGLNRLSSVSYPDGGLTTYCYTDWLPGNSFPAASSVRKSALENTSGTYITSNTILDGMGHTIHSQATSDPAGSDVVDTVYSGLGQVYTVSNPYRNTSNGLTTYTYDALGRKTSQTNPDGSSQTRSYSGSTVTVTDENRNQWQRTSDALGRLINVLEPNGANTVYSYDALDNLLKVNQNGNGTTDTPRTPRTFTYDSASRLLCASNPENSSGTCPATAGSGAYVAGTTGYTYDANGNVATKTDARVISTYYYYDALNRLLAKNYNSGDPSACMQYDNALSSATGANFKGRLTAEWTAPSGQCPNTMAHPVSSIPANAYNNTVVQGYDPMGRTQLEQQCPSGSSCGSNYQFSYLYDLAGNIVQFNNGMPAANNSPTLPAIGWGNTWNAAGQLQSLTVGNQPWAPSTLYPTTLIQALSTAASPAYDPMGHLVDAQLGINSSGGGPAINVVRQYDNRGRIVAEADSGTSSGTGGTGSTSTSGSTTLTISGGPTFQTVCHTVPSGPYGQPTQVCYTSPNTGNIYVTIGGFTVTINFGAQSDSAMASQLAADFNVSGSPVTATASNNSVVITAIATGTASNYPINISDDSGYIISDPNSSLSGGANGSSGSSSGTIYSYTVPQNGYAPNGNILSHTDSVMGAWNFGYDTLNRLTSANASSGGYAGQYGCWIYDSFGNRTLEAYSTATSTPCANMNSPLALPNNRLPTLTYDAAGNVYQDGTNTYAYDAEGRLCAVSQPSINGGAQFQYLYDASGARVGKATFTGSFPLINNTCAAPGAASGFTLKNQYLLDLSGDQVTELDGGGNWVHSNAFEGGRLSATYDTQGLHFAIADPLGTKRVEVGTAGCATSYASLPYGNGLTPGTVPGYSQCNLDATEHHFTGKERDTESGNDYFGARYYNSAMGRFMSPDWSAKIMPVPYAKLDNPQSLNLYAYVGNNPLTRFDPDGHTVPDSCAKDSKCSITVKVNVILDKNAKLTKADWKAFQKDFLGKAQKDFGNSNIKLDYTFTNGSISDDGAVKGAKSGYLNFVATDKEPGGTDGGSQTTKNGTALSYIDIKGAGSGGGPRSSNIFVDSNVFEHELGQQFLGTQGTRTWGADVVRQFTIDPINTEQGWGMSSQSYRTGLEPASFSTPTNPQQ